MLRRVAVSIEDAAENPGVWTRFAMSGFRWRSETTKEPLEITAFPIKLRALVIDELTRHRSTDQIFIPLTGSLLVVAGPSREDDPDRPDPQQLRMLPVQVGEAVNVHTGTWHTLPFALVREVVCISVMHREDLDSYHDIRDLAAEGWIGIPCWRDPE
jgi:ureidoglycolate hydrolase